MAKKEDILAYPIIRSSSRIVGAGMSLPERIVTNEHFAAYLETTDEWIRERTGIIERRWVEGAVGASELAEPAARQAIENAGLSVGDIDGIIFATVTPDYLFPSSACFLQKRLGIRSGLAFDVNAVCSGFVYALATADALIARGLCKNVVVVGCDIYSPILNPHDRRTCILFGDGAGAVVLQATSSEGGKLSRGGAHIGEEGSGETLRGIYSSQLGADGHYTDILCVPRGTAAPMSAESIQTDAHYLQMEGREVFKLAVRRLAEINESVVVENGFDISQVDWFASHQANKRILLAVAKSIGLPEEKVLMNLERFGNTSAASVPILLAESEQKGLIKPGDLIVLSAFGGGVTWGSILLRW